MEKKPRLSVAIPTYNRSRFLKENISNIAFQIARLSESVEIVVSDNASTDETQKIIREHIAHIGPISYFRNETNLGMDENADLAIKRSCGDYVLLLGDDDLLELNALATIIKCIINHPSIGIIYINFKIFDAELENKIDFRDVAFDPIEKNFYVADGIEVLKKTKKIFAAISGGIYRRDLWVNANAERFYGSIFIHVGITLDILCRMRQPAFIFKEPLFKYRLNNSSPGKIKSYQDIFEVSFGLLGILLSHKKYLPTYIYREMYKKELLWSRKNVLGAKARESVRVKETFFQMRKSYDTSRLDFWFIDVPILMIPQWILYAPYQLYRRIRYQKVK
jgi:glycosyltransferase involved in cell wall biosynthesis